MTINNETTESKIFKLLSFKLTIVSPKNLFPPCIFPKKDATVWKRNFCTQNKGKYNGILDADRFIFCWLGRWLDLEDDLR